MDKTDKVSINDDKLFLLSVHHYGLYIRSEVSSRLETSDVSDAVSPRLLTISQKSEQGQLRVESALAAVRQDCVRLFGPALRLFFSPIFGEQSLSR